MKKTAVFAALLILAVTLVPALSVRADEKIYTFAAILARFRCIRPSPLSTRLNRHAICGALNITIGAGNIRILFARTTFAAIFARFRSIRPGTLGTRLNRHTICGALDITIGTGNSRRRVAFASFATISTGPLGTFPMTIETILNRIPITSLVPILALQLDFRIPDASRLSVNFRTNKPIIARSDF